MRAFALAPSGYADLGVRHWLLAHCGAFDPVAVRLMRDHYSRRKPQSPQFMPPGNRYALVTRTMDAVWGWWRNEPTSGVKHRSGFDGWWCTAFRNTGPTLSSELVLEAELALRELVADDCGPDGMLTYVDPRRVRSSNPGCCFKKAGWVHIGWSSRRRRMLFRKPYALAGMARAA